MRSECPSEWPSLIFKDCRVAKRFAWTARTKNISGSTNTTSRTKGSSPTTTSGQKWRDRGMIQCRLYTKSGVAPYLQLVQQTKDALRLGVLHPGDQLPTVKEVVSTIAINPNTVLKAYRELDREGLVEGRPGVGTFVLKSLGGPNADHPRLRRRLERWVDD